MSWSPTACLWLPVPPGCSPSPSLDQPPQYWGVPTLAQPGGAPQIGGGGWGLARGSSDPAAPSMAMLARTWHWGKGSPKSQCWGNGAPAPPQYLCKGGPGTPPYPERGQRGTQPAIAPSTGCPPRTVPGGAHDPDLTWCLPQHPRVSPPMPHLRVEPVDPPLNLRRHGPLLELQLPGVHHGPGGGWEGVSGSPMTPPVFLVPPPAHRSTERLLAPMSWQPCWIPAIK